MSVNLKVVGCSPAWPNPGGAQSGYLLEGPGRLLLDCGPGVLARLRNSESWPTVDAIAITHWHLDHWGDLVPWVWGGTLGPGVDVKKPELWVPPEGSEMLAAIGGRLGQQQMFEEAFNLHEYADGET
ncbi:MAG: MBL fold metallo-hydrolase, partial [Actinobacteria bacterium]